MLLTFVSTMALLSVRLCVYAAHAVHVARMHTCIIAQLLRWWWNSCWCVLMLLVCWVMSTASLRWRKSVSVDTYLVKMSAVLLAVLILMILTRSCCTTCWRKSCLSSMCLAFFDEPLLVAMLLPLDESVWIRMFIFLMFNASCGRLRMCSASVAPVLMA